MAQLIENPYYKSPYQEFLMGGGGALIPTTKSFAPEPIIPPAERRMGDWGTISKPFATPLSYGDEGDTYADVERQRQPVTNEGYNYEVRALTDSVKNFDAQMKALNDLKKRMDPIAQERYTNVNKRYSALHRAYAEGKVNQLELFREASRLGGFLGTFDWQAHISGKGSAPGDIYEDEESGMVMQNVAGKGPVPINYTSKYRKEHTQLDPYGRYVEIPTMPGKEPKILSAKEYRDDTLGESRVKDMTHAVEKEIELMVASPKYFGKSTAELAPIAIQAIKDRRDAIRRAVAEETGTEINLSPAQQKRTVEEEMGMRPRVPAVAPITKTEQKQAAEQAKVSAKAAGTDKPTQDEYRAKHWEDDPQLVLASRQAVAIKTAQDLKNTQNDRVYILVDRNTRQPKMYVKLSGKFFPLEATRKAELSQQMFSNSY